MYLSESQMEKWAPVLDHPELPAIKDSHRRNVTAVILENQEKAVREERVALHESLPGNHAGPTGEIDNYDPVLISLVRRALPNLMAYDVCGVQPMTGPTGLIFAMKSHYTSQAGGEALFNEADTDFSGTGTHAGSNPVDGTYTTGAGMTTNAGEQVDPAEMAFSIEKTTVTAKTRALKAEYTIELAQDLKAIHGLDAETELANILSTEILAEINREIIRTINSQAKLGCIGTSTSGIFDLSSDADGRWSAEKFKGLVVQLDREANVIAKETRRGKGNIVVCSSDVATALAASGMLDYTPAMNTSLSIDDTGNTFAGTLNGRLRVFIDPYATTNYVTVGYKGTNPYDAGMFYCPYVPLQMVKAVGENDFQPRIGFKTRYGMVANPFVTDNPTSDIDTTKGLNQYYRIFRVDNILDQPGS